MRTLTWRRAESDPGYGVGEGLETSAGAVGVHGVDGGCGPEDVGLGGKGGGKSAARRSVWAQAAAARQSVPVALRIPRAEGLH